MRTNKSASNPQVHFSDVNEWLDFAKNKTSGKDEHFNNIYDGGFQGKYSGVELVERIKARQCNEQTRSIVHKKSVSLPPVGTEIGDQDIMQLYNDQSGLFLDSTAYFSGEDDCMINFDIQETARPIIWIACNIGGMAGITPEQFRNRGISLIRAIHALERAGVSIGLIGYSKANGSGSTSTALQTIVVKCPENALDESTLINVFADVNAFRTIGFTVRGIITKQKGRAPVMGSTMTTTAKDYKLSYASEHDLVILPYENMGVYNNPESATEYTLDQVRQQAKITL